MHTAITREAEGIQAVPVPAEWGLWSLRWSNVAGSFKSWREDLLLWPHSLVRANCVFVAYAVSPVCSCNLKVSTKMPHLAFASLKGHQSVSWPSGTSVPAHGPGPHVSPWGSQLLLQQCPAGSVCSSPQPVLKIPRGAPVASSPKELLAPQVI